MTLRLHSKPHIIPISGVVQRYAWGKIGSDSVVGNLSGEARVSPSTPFAELWFGAHRSYPSLLVVPPSTIPERVPSNLCELLAASPTNEALPFLFKILSVAKPLSIQLHPNKAQAEKLHRNAAQHYPDANHKPELAVALTNVEMVCGIRTIAELTRLWSIFPVLTPILTPLSTRQTDQEKVEEIFRTLFTIEPTVRASIIASIFESTATGFWQDPLRCMKAASQYNAADDPGLLALLLLRYVSLAPGEAVYIAPGTPHAYLFGDLAECMASSDNVVRAGLTEKYIDVETFLQLVQYTPEQSPLLSPRSTAVDHAFEFRPPVPDFRLFRIMRGETNLSALTSGTAILMCYRGTAVVCSERSQKEHALTQGDAVFIPQITSDLTVSSVDGELFLAAQNL